MFITNAAGRKYYVLRRISTGEILNPWTLYPRAIDDEPIEGGDPDLEYLPIDRDEEPDVDKRLFKTVPQPGAKVGNVWKLTWATVPTSKEQRKMHALNKKAEKLAEMLPLAEQVESVVLAVSIIRRKADGLSLTVDEAAQLEHFDEIAAGARANLETYSEIIEAIEQGGDPDLEAGWTPPIEP